ncbi:MAG: hypothetical protein J5977_05005 [Fibrobacter sp.]|nr:hypothetical protein [Fibrobacter sp.]
MNSVIKFAMAASALALVACSGKGSADATLDGQEFFKDDSPVYCQATYNGELMACGQVSANKCGGDGDGDKVEYSIATSCPSGYRDKCSVDHETIYVYNDHVSCDDFVSDDDDDDDKDSDNDIAPISNSGSIGSICDNYTQICSGVYGCFDDGEVYSCTSSSCTKLSEDDATSACGFEY